MSSNTPPYRVQKMPTSDVTIGIGGRRGTRGELGWRYNICMKSVRYVQRLVRIKRLYQKEIKS